MIQATNLDIFEEFIKAGQYSGRLGAGRTFWVGNGTAQHDQNGPSDSVNGGLSPKNPLSTWDYATGLCAAGRGDNVVFLPGHAESIVAAAGSDCDIAGVRYVGMGKGSQAPLFTFSTATTADVDIDAADVTFDNLRFLAGIADLANIVDVNAARFHMVDCDVFMSDATLDVISAVLADANADFMKIERCTFRGTGTTLPTGSVANAVQFAGADDVSIIDCEMQGPFTVASGAIYNTAAALRCRILRNIIINHMTASDACISMHASTTGIYDHNLLGILNGTAPVVAAGMYRGGYNRYAAAVNSTQVVLP